MQPSDTAVFPVDPIELELARNLLEAAAEEMGITLGRVSFSANIKERRDFSCALFDADGQPARASGAHPGAPRDRCRPVVCKRCGKRLGDLDDGDVAIVNDPFAGGNALAGHHDRVADFRRRRTDRLRGQPGASCRRRRDQPGVDDDQQAHRRRREFGSSRRFSVPGRGRETIRCCNRILNAVRTPTERLNDLDAQLAANAVGARATFGNRARRSGAWLTSASYGRALLEYSRGIVHDRNCDPRSIPDGTDTALPTTPLDDDGAGTVADFDCGRR